MPAFLKTKEDERLWSKAKAVAKEQGHAEDWAYVTGIWKKMTGKGASMSPSAERVASRHLAYDEKGRDPDNGWEDGEVEEFIQTVGEGSQVPFPRDNGGAEIPAPKFPAMDIPGYGELKKASQAPPRR